MFSALQLLHLQIRFSSYSKNHQSLARQLELAVKYCLATYDGLVFSHQSEHYKAHIAQPPGRKIAMTNFISRMQWNYLASCMIPKKYSLIQNTLKAYHVLVIMQSIGRYKEKNKQSLLLPVALVGKTDNKHTGEIKRRTQGNQLNELGGVPWKYRGRAAAASQFSVNSSSATLHHWCATGTAVFLNMTAGMHVSRSNHRALSAGEQWVPQTASIFYTNCTALLSIYG